MSDSCCHHRWHKVMKTLHCQTLLYLEDKTFGELRVGPRAPGPGLPGPAVVGQQLQLHQHHVAVETGREVAEAQQGHRELLAGLTVLHGEAEPGGGARGWGHHLVRGGATVQALQQGPHGVPA